MRPTAGPNERSLAPSDPNLCFKHSNVAESSPESSPNAADRVPTSVVDKSGSRVREMFRQIAPRYDLMNHLLSLNIDRYWRRRAVGRLQLRDDFPVLDVCTGTGDLALAIARGAKSSTRVLGSDFCHAMLEIARDKAMKQAAGIKPTASTAEFIEADAQQLPFADDTFQCVTVAFGLRNVADTDVGLREMTRVCRPGGQVVVLEFSQPTVPVLSHTYRFYFRHVLPRVGQWLARNDKSAYQYLPESVGEFPCGQVLADRMFQAGLIDVTYTPLTLGVATIYEGIKPLAASDESQVTGHTT